MAKSPMWILPTKNPTRNSDRPIMRRLVWNWLPFDWGVCILDIRFAGTAHAYLEINWISNLVNMIFIAWITWIRTCWALIANRMVTFTNRKNINNFEADNTCFIGNLIVDCDCRCRRIAQCCVCWWHFLWTSSDWIWMRIFSFIRWSNQMEKVELKTLFDWSFAPK